MKMKTLNLNEKSLGPNIISVVLALVSDRELLTLYINWVVKLSYKLTEIDIWKGSVM